MGFDVEDYWDQDEIDEILKLSKETRDELRELNASVARLLRLKEAQMVKEGVKVE